MHRQVLFPQSKLLDLTVLLAGVDAIRAVTIQAQCHVMRKFFFFCLMFVRDKCAHTEAHSQVFYHLLLSYLKMPGDTMFSV